MNGAIPGMKKREIDRKLGEIGAFAEIERFPDAPVKRYSSGTYACLAFALSAPFSGDLFWMAKRLFTKSIIESATDINEHCRRVFL